MTVQQGVDFLANRQVGLRHSCAPPLEKLAEPKTEPTTPDAGSEGGVNAGGTLAALLAHPSMQAALLGTLGGGGIGLIAGLRRKKERRNVLRDILTGAFAGGIGIGGLHLAGSKLLGGVNKDDVDHTTFGLPAPDAKSQAEWVKTLVDAGKTPEEIRALQIQKLKEWHKVDAAGALDHSQDVDPGTPGFWTDPTQMLSAAWDIPASAGRGLGRLGGEFGGMALGREKEQGTWGDIAGSAGATAGGVGVPAWLLAASANKFKAPHDLSGSRLGAIGEALFGEKAFDVKKTGPVRNEASSALHELYETRFGKGQVDAKNLDIIRQGLHGGDTDALRKFNDLLVSGPADLPAATDPGYRAAVDANTARATARNQFMGFLSDLRTQSAKHSKGLPKDAPRTNFGNILVDDARLGHVASTVQQGKIPFLNKYTGINPRVRPNAPLDVKLPFTARFPAPKLRGPAGWLLGLGGLGLGADYHQRRQSGAQTYGEGVQDFLKSVTPEEK